MHLSVQSRNPAGRIIRSAMNSTLNPLTKARWMVNSRFPMKADDRTFVQAISRARIDLKFFSCCLMVWVYWFFGPGIQLSAAEAITTSLKAIAGEYYFGDGTGVNCSLNVHQRGTFSFQWRGCLGTYDE